MEYISSPKGPHRLCSSDNLILFKTPRPSSSAARQTASGPDFSPVRLYISVCPVCTLRPVIFSSNEALHPDVVFPSKLSSSFHRSSSMGSSHPVLLFRYCGIIHSSFHNNLLNSLYFTISWTAVAQWLRCCATNRKVAGSIPAGVSGYFIDVKSFRSHYGPGVDSFSSRNKYQVYLLRVKAAGA